jgi:hypothetical protein
MSVKKPTKLDQGTVSSMPCNKLLWNPIDIQLPVGESQIWANNGSQGGPPHVGNDPWIVFYANDRRERCWVPDMETAVPKPKGEGASLMISDFVSADYGWLRFPDGKGSAHIVIRPGANRDGYFTNSGILAKATIAIDIVQKCCPHDNHIIVFDNAPTDLKRSDTALSARKMPRGMSKLDKNWLVETPSLNELDKPLYGLNGKKLMKKVPMADESPQSFYFPEGHQSAGYFKGMKVILEEQGLASRSAVSSESASNFVVLPVVSTAVSAGSSTPSPTSRLEEHCQTCGSEVLFLPKFLPELNFIEQ